MKISSIIGFFYVPHLQERRRESLEFPQCSTKESGGVSNISTWMDCFGFQFSEHDWIMYFPNLRRICLFHVSNIFSEVCQLLHQRSKKLKSRREVSTTMRFFYCLRDGRDFESECGVWSCLRRWAGAAKLVS